MNRRNFLSLTASSSLIAAAGSQLAEQASKVSATACPAPVSSRSIRDQFLMSDEQVWFNSGGLGAVPKSVLDKVTETMMQLQIRTSHGHNLIEKARPIVAEFLGCHKDELAFTRNATEGNSTIASGLQLKPGDEVILDSHSHQGGSLAWLTRQKYDGVVVKIFDPDPESVQGNLDRIATLITDRTRVIQVSHVTAPTGIRMPVQKIGHLAQGHDIWFHIDGAQSLGMFPFKVSELNCDSFAACCHKWMCGPQGTGVLFVRHDRLDDIIPTEVGSYADQLWNLPATLEYVPTARRFECGTRDASSITGIVEAIRFLETLGRAPVSRHGFQLADQLRKGLRPIAKLTVLSPSHPELKSAMVSFVVNGMNCDDVFRFLLKHGFRCRPVRERGLNAVRVSTHLFNTADECDQLIALLKQYLEAC